MKGWKNNSSRSKLLLAILPLVITLSATGCSVRDGHSATENTVAAETSGDIPYSIVRRLTVSELHDALNKGSAIAVDVRHSEEYRARAIKGAFFIDQLLNDPEFTSRAQGKLVVTYCACPAEITSARVALELRDKGYQNVAALLGGYDAWDDARLPTEPGQMH